MPYKWKKVYVRPKTRQHRPKWRKKTAAGAIQRMKKKIELQRAEIRKLRYRK